MGALTIIFAFMVFMIILNKGHLYFFSIFSLLLVVATSLGVGYGMAYFVCWLFESILQLIPIVIIAVIVLLIGFAKGGK